MSAPDFDRQANVATEVSIAALEAGLKAVPETGKNLTEDEAIGVLTGLLRAAGRWASFTMPPEWDEGIHMMLGKVLEQERRNRVSDQAGVIQ